MLFLARFVHAHRSRSSRGAKREWGGCRHGLTGLLLAVGVSAAVAQGGPCSEAFAVGPDSTAMCAGASVTISASPGFAGYVWNTGDSTQTITTDTAGTYICTALGFTTANSLAVNGDFSAGATGFSSDYVPGTGGTWGILSLEGTYAVAANPHDTHINFASFGDHTTGTGQMLVVNGAATADQDIWCQTIPVTPYTTYAFSAWLTSVTAIAPAILDFTVNGTSLGTPLLATTITGQWLQFYALWNSGSATSATICISNQNTATSGNDFAIDDIAFSPVCTYTDQAVVVVNAYPQPDLGPDISVCDGVPVTLDPAWPAADSYLWSDGSSAPTLGPQGSGTQWVDVTENGCTTRDSVDVTFRPLPTVDLGPDQTLCAGQSITLHAYYPGATYLWQDGSTASAFTVTTTTTAAVTVSLAGCDAGDTAVIAFNPLPVVDLGPDVLVCPDSVLAFNVAQPGGSYLWDDGDTSPHHTISSMGRHWLEVTVANCSSSDSMAVQWVQPIDLDLGPDFILCIGTTATLDAGVQPGPDLHYLWDDGSTGPTRRIDDADLYYVTVRNVCAMASDSIVVTKSQCDCPVFVPDAFTPDDDDLNDLFAPVFDCQVDYYQLLIFDRWGQPVWSSNDPKAGWDGGTGKGQAPPDIYEWVLTITPHTLYDAVPHRLFGHVLLVR